MFDSDWARCLSCGIGRLILRLDDEDDDDADGSDEVKEVADVLWEFHDLINVMFDYYAAQGASSDITEITPNGFQLFASDCGLPDKRSKFSKTADFDRLGRWTSGHARSAESVSHSWMECTTCMIPCAVTREPEWDGGSPTTAHERGSRSLWIQ